MKKAIILGILAYGICTSNQVFGQEIFADIFNKMAIKAAPQHEQANIEWISTTKHNFGDISQNKTAIYDFQFTNTSNIPIKITNAHSSSGCVVPIWKNQAILPNEIGTIRVVFCAEQTGAFNKIIKVYFQDTKQAEALYIEGMIND